MEPTKFLLDEEALPESWYNVVPDLPFGLDPPLNPATREPVGPRLSPRSFLRPSSARK
jgi:tryptophan synthase beta chain